MGRYNKNEKSAAAKQLNNTFSETQFANVLFYIGLFIIIVSLAFILYGFENQFFFLGILISFLGYKRKEYLTKKDIVEENKVEVVFTGEIIVDDLFLYSEKVYTYTSYNEKADRTETIAFYGLISNNELLMVHPSLSYLFKYNAIKNGSRLQIKAIKENGFQKIIEASIVELGIKNLENEQTILQKFVGQKPTHIDHHGEVSFKHEIIYEEPFLAVEFKLLKIRLNPNSKFSELTKEPFAGNYYCNVNGNIIEIDWPTFQTKKIGDTL